MQYDAQQSGLRGGKAAVETTRINQSTKLPRLVSRIVKSKRDEGALVQNGQACAGNRATAVDHR